MSWLDNVISHLTPEYNLNSDLNLSPYHTHPDLYSMPDTTGIHRRVTDLLRITVVWVIPRAGIMGSYWDQLPAGVVETLHANPTNGNTKER